MRLHLRRISYLSSLVMIAVIFGYSHSQAQTKPWVAPVAAQNIVNPLAGNTASLKEAKVLYAANCSPCHGDRGKGDGPAAAALNPKPADHTSAALRNESDGSLFWKISEGRSPMPTYKSVLTETQRWELVNFIRSLSGKKW